jgi:hypothetical protein
MVIRPTRAKKVAILPILSVIKHLPYKVLARISPVDARCVCRVFKSFLLGIAAIGIPGSLTLSVTAVLNKSRNINILYRHPDLCAKTETVHAQKGASILTAISDFDLIVQV